MKHGTSVRVLNFKYSPIAKAVRSEIKKRKKTLKAFAIAGAALTAVGVASQAGAVITFAAGFVAFGLYNEVSRKGPEPEPKKLFAIKRDDKGHICGVDHRDCVQEIAMCVCITAAYISWQGSDAYWPQEVNAAKQECFAQIYKGEDKCSVPITYEKTDFFGWFDEKRTGNVAMNVVGQEADKLSLKWTTTLPDEKDVRSLKLVKDDKGLQKRACEHPGHKNMYSYVYKLTN